MSYKLKISVTKEILWKSRLCGKGDENISLNCAISLAVRDIFPDAWIDSEEIIPFAKDFTLGDYKGISFIKPLDNHINLPYAAIDFIVKFDRLEDKPEERIKMEPISFEINVSDEIIKRIGISEVKEILQNSKTLELIEA